MAMTVMILFLITTATIVMDNFNVSYDDSDEDSSEDEENNEEDEDNNCVEGDWLDA
jgi:hypothetical protein